MIVWTTVSTKLLDGNPAILRWVTNEDQIGAQKSNNPTVQRNSLLAKASLRALLYYTTHKRDWIFKPDKYGKPSVWSPSGAIGPAITLSHTKGMIACALSESKSIGIDVEYHRFHPYPEIASLAFGPNEQAYASTAGAESFYKIWTLREARSKATGKGLVSATNGRDQITKPWEKGCWTDQEWNLFFTSPGSDYSLAIATQGDPGWSLKSLIVVPQEDLT